MSAVDPKWQSHMPPRYTDLTTGLRVSGAVLDHLFQAGLLSPEERSRVDKVQPNTEGERVRCLLELLERKPPGSFEKFCNVLDKAGHKHLADMLRSESKHTYKNKIIIRVEPTSLISISHGFGFCHGHDIN